MFVADKRKFGKLDRNVSLVPYVILLREVPHLFEYFF